MYAMKLEWGFWDVLQLFFCQVDINLEIPGMSIEKAPLSDWSVDISVGYFTDC